MSFQEFVHTWIMPRHSAVGFSTPPRKHTQKTQVPYSLLIDKRSKLRTPKCFTAKETKRNRIELGLVKARQGKAIYSTKWYVSPNVWHIRNGTTQPLRQSNKRTQRLQWVEMERSKVNSNAPPIIHRFQWWKMDSFNLPKNRKIESWAVNRPAMKMLKIEAWG